MFALLSLGRDRLIAADPGLSRLLLAARVTLGVAFTVLALEIGAAAFDIPVSVAILGAIVAMQAALAINDPDPRTTTLVAPLPGTIGIVLGAIFASRGVLADLVFLVVLFTAVAIRVRGARWTAYGTIAMMTYFFALFLDATIRQLPALIAAVFTAVAWTYLVRFVLLPDRPAWIAKRTIDAFEARIRSVSVAAKDLLESREPRSARRRLDTLTDRLNETATAIESRLGQGATDELRIIFDAELAAEDLAAAARALRDAAAPVPRSVRLALQALGSGRTARAARLAAGLAADQTPSHAAAHAVAAAIVDLGETIVRVDATTAMLALSDAPWSGSSGPQQPVMRQAIQVTVGSAMAIALGEALSAQRWYWAVLTTYFVFLGTASSGETLERAWSRTGGTALGVAAGVVVGHLAIGHPLFDLIAIFACLFLGVYFLRISYMLMIFFITALLALLYTLLGRFSDGLLGVRLIETAVGAICGGFAATFILPTRTHDVVRASATAALAAAQAAVHASIARLLDPQGAGIPLLEARVLEESVQHFVARAKPAIAAPTLTGRGHELRRWIVSLSACSYYARMLARAADRTELRPSAAVAARLAGLDALIAANIAAASERVSGQHDRETKDSRPLFDALRREANVDAPSAGPLLGATHVLERLDRTIARLARDEGTITEIA